MIRYTAFIIVTLAIVGDSLAQIIPEPSPAEATRAAQLPLSGRSPQGGAVTATQSPIPGTTTSVNTINPSIQVQGPYTGSTSSAAFNGKLTLGDAMDRGFASNLGPVGW